MLRSVDFEPAKGEAYTSSPIVAWHDDANHHCNQDEGKYLFLAMLPVGHGC